MDLHRLEIFCKVVELKSFTRAAEAVSLSQPTVSEHIRSLEEMFDERLVDRLGREAIPTQAGQILYKYARRLLQTQQEAIQAIKQYSGKLSGTLLLGAGTIPGTYILPRLIGAFKNRYPSIRIVLKISSSRSIAKEVIKGDLEMGVVGARWSDPTLDWEERFSDELVLAVAPQHRWAGRDEVTLEDLAGESFVLRERFSGTRKVMTAILEEHGFSLADADIVAEMGSTEAVRQGIKAQVGVSILSRRAVADDIQCGALVAVPIKDVRMFRPFYLIKRKKRHITPICEAFLNYLRDEQE